MNGNFITGLSSHMSDGCLMYHHPVCSLFQEQKLNSFNTFLYLHPPSCSSIITLCQTTVLKDNNTHGHQHSLIVVVNHENGTYAERIWKWACRNLDCLIGTSLTHSSTDWHLRQKIFLIISNSVSYWWHQFLENVVRSRHLHSILRENLKMLCVRSKGDT